MMIIRQQRQRHRHGIDANLRMKMRRGNNHGRVVSGILGMSRESRRPTWIDESKESGQRRALAFNWNWIHISGVKLRRCSRAIHHFDELVCYQMLIRRVSIEMACLTIMPFIGCKMGLVFGAGEWQWVPKRFIWMWMIAIMQFDWSAPHYRCRGVISHRIAPHPPLINNTLESFIGHHSKMPLSWI